MEVRLWVTHPSTYPTHAEMMMNGIHGGGGGGGGGGSVDQDGWQMPPQEWLNEQHERPVGPPPASSRVLKRMPDVIVKEEDLALDQNKDGCAVCMEPLVLGSKCLRLPCSHMFHRYVLPPTHLTPVSQ